MQSKNDSQPLDGKELRGKIAKIFYGIYALHYRSDNTLYGRSWEDAKSPEREQSYDKADQILALLQPKIEEGREQATLKVTDIYGWTDDEVAVAIEEARRQGIRMAIDNLKKHHCIIDTEAKIKEIENG